jgi:hypothetical protein
MADTIYVYKGKMWKVMQSFVYTGTGEPFTLPAGQYLLMCNGAHGGKFSVGYNLGGLSMGVIHLTEETNMFAYVGGNGGDSQANGQPPTAGGFNGGADGGLPYSSSYRAGIGGGGGTDIRIGEDSLYARVIVAGGGGGAPSYSTSYAHITGTGGGSVGGYVHSGGASEGKYASQTDGYSFGVGQVASEKMSNSSNGSNGAGGGGGGWYGGYAIQEDGNYTSGNGGGGSGYVLTADSYKPEGYLLGEEYYLTDTFMCGGAAEEPGIAICQEVLQFNSGDTLIYPSTGNAESLLFSAGQYRLKCWGGDGGACNGYNTCARGGYAEGVLTLEQMTTIISKVGGTGLGSGMHCEPPIPEYMYMHRPILCYNGGGLPSTNIVIDATGGGGGTDFRIGEDSLYARVIVAGGAGGAAYNAGSAGGGLTGGPTPSGSGNNNGPGTQTSAPSNVDAGVAGGFGYGSNGHIGYSGGNQYYGAAGGGGWYGGSGTWPYVTSTNRGGCGGSGYVLTADSYKPEGYLLGEEYYLTDTVLTQGGNNLPYGINRSIIEVIEAQQFIFLIASDSEGYKKFNLLTSAWEYFAPIETELTEEIFTENGVTSFTTDTGLLSQYNILAWDSEDIVRGIQYNVTPSAQRVSRTVASTIIPKNITVDADYSPSDIVLNITASRSEVDGVQYLTLNADIIPIGTGNVKLYAINVYSSQ